MGTVKGRHEGGLSVQLQWPINRQLRSLFLLSISNTNSLNTKGKNARLVWAGWEVAIGSPYVQQATPSSTALLLAGSIRYLLADEDAEGVNEHVKMMKQMARVIENS